MQQPPGHPEATENRAARDQEVFQSKSIKQCVQKFHNRGQQFSGTFREHHLSAMHTYKYSRRCCPHCLTGLELNQLSLQIIVFLVSYKPVPVASNRTWQQPGYYIWFGSVVQLLHPLRHPLNLITERTQLLRLILNNMKTQKATKPSPTNNSLEHCSQFWHDLPHVWSWAFSTAVTFDKLQYKEVVHAHSLQPKHGNPTDPTNTTEQYPSDYRLVVGRLQFRPCQISSAYWKAILRASSCSSFDICPAVVAIHNGSHISSRII